MKIPIGALTRELISTHQWIFPVVNGKRIGHEMDVASIYLSDSAENLAVQGEDE